MSIVSGNRSWARRVQYLMRWLRWAPIVSRGPATNLMGSSIGSPKSGLTENGWGRVVATAMASPGSNSQVRRGKRAVRLIWTPAALAQVPPRRRRNGWMSTGVPAWRLQCSLRQLWKSRNLVIFWMFGYGGNDGTSVSVRGMLGPGKYGARWKEDVWLILVQSQTRKAPQSSDVSLSTAELKT